MTTPKKRIAKIMGEFGVKFDESKYKDLKSESDVVKQMTPQDLMNNAIAKKIGWEQGESGWKLVNGYTVSPTFTDISLGWFQIHGYMIPWVNKQENAVELWTDIYAELPVSEQSWDAADDDSITALLDFVYATPEQISVAFLRATGAWTKKMEAGL